MYALPYERGYDPEYDLKSGILEFMSEEEFTEAFGEDVPANFVAEVDEMVDAIHDRAHKYKVEGKKKTTDLVNKNDSVELVKSHYLWLKN